MNLVDSHCHLDNKQFGDGLAGVIERAMDVGVSRFLTIGTGELDVAVRISERYENVWATVGVHPHDASKADARTFDETRRLARHPRVVAIGEVGLDYHYDFSPREAQRDVFIEHMRIAQECGKSLIIHTREAWADTMALLGEHWTGAGIMHCFTGDAAQAREALDLGFYLAFGGVLTFPKSESVREAARIVPDNRILVETDCPYLAPIPFRGKRNEPAYMVHTVNKLAEVRGETPEQVAAKTTQNFERLLGLH